jgi:RNA recognition motif-containing protein
MKIYVGNLPWRFSDQELNDLFARVGTVQSAKVITDRETGRSRGFGFVEMSQADGERAISELNGTQVQNRALRINEANERPPRSGGGGGGGGGGRGGYSGGGGGGRGGYGGGGGGGGGYGGGGGGYRDRGDRGDRDRSDDRGDRDRF